jgi:hypothetical protein
MDLYLAERLRTRPYYASKEYLLWWQHTGYRIRRARGYFKGLGVRDREFMDYLTGDSDFNLVEWQVRAALAIEHLVIPQGVRIECPSLRGWASVVSSARSAGVSVDGVVKRAANLIAFARDLKGKKPQRDPSGISNESVNARKGFTSWARKASGEWAQDLSVDEVLELQQVLTQAADAYLAAHRSGSGLNSTPGDASE